MSKFFTFCLVELVFSFIGTGIASALYYAHQANITLPCTSGGGCELVELSKWSHLFGIHVALIGAVGYAALALLSVVKWNAISNLVAFRIRILMILTAFGATAFSWYLQYRAMVDIGAFCIYCRASAITITLIFLTLITEAIVLCRDSGIVEGAPVSQPS